MAENPNNLNPAGALPVMPLSEALTSANENRPVSIFDASKVRLMVVVTSDNPSATIKCNMPRADAARLLRYLADGIERPG